MSARQQFDDRKQALFSRVQQMIKRPISHCFAVNIDEETEHMYMKSADCEKLSGFTDIVRRTFNVTFENNDHGIKPTYDVGDENHIEQSVTADSDMGPVTMAITLEKRQDEFQKLSLPSSCVECILLNDRLTIPHKNVQYVDVHGICLIDNNQLYVVKHATGENTEHIRIQYD